MIVYVLFEYSYDGFHTHKYYIDVVNSKELAIQWVKMFNNTQYDWREYEETLVIDNLKDLEWAQ